MKKLLTFCLLFSSLHAFSETLSITFDIPKINTAEYHEPYVAVWVEDKQNAAVGDILVWHEQTKWLKDLRSWWRKSGRYKTLPIDGVTGATKRPGTHTVSWETGALANGDYTLFIEAVREVGGREKLKIPFTIPSQKSFTQEVNGTSELGTAILTIN